MTSNEQKHRPYISEKSIRLALDALLYTSSNRDIVNPLNHLMLVDEVLTNPDFPLNTRSRYFAIQYILVSIIIRVLSEHRQVLSLPPPEENRALKDVLDEIVVDFQQEIPELIGWSILYYRYVRVDLGIKLEQLAQMIAVDERTLRRYQSHAIRRLMEYLTTEEWGARNRQRKRRLYSVLPTVTLDPLLGRESSFDHLRNIYANYTPYHIQVTGEAGIGKSVFIQKLLHQRIEEEQIDQIVWLDKPTSRTQINQYLHECLLPENSSIGLREYMLFFRIAVVLDEVAALSDEEIEDLLLFLNPAEVYITSRIYRPFANIAAHIELRELDKSDAIDLMHYTLSSEKLNSGQQLIDDELLTIWDTVGGNPLAIKLAVRNMVFGIHNLDNSLDKIYNQLYSDLTRSQKYTWIACALFPPNKVNLNQMLIFWSALISNADILYLQQYHLIEVDVHQPHLGNLSTAARHFIQQKHDVSSEVRELTDLLLDELDLEILKNTSEVLGVAEYVLFAGWTKITPKRYHDWIQKLWQKGINQGHRSYWRTILEHFISFSESTVLEFQIAYGICLRKLSEWDQARHVFECVIVEAGRTGVFDEQAWALLELSILHRSQGNYQNAAAFLQRVEGLLERRPDETLEQQLRLEQAQLKIDQNDGVIAQKYLSQLHDTGRVLALRSEAALLIHHYQESLVLAHQALGFFQNDPIASARIHILIGRNHEQQNNYTEALNHLSLSVTLLEHSQDVWGTGRALLNLGALLIHEKAYHDAYAALNRAEHILSQLGDRTGLAAARHNLQLSKAYITN